MNSTGGARKKFSARFARRNSCTPWPNVCIRPCTYLFLDFALNRLLPSDAEMDTSMDDRENAKTKAESQNPTYSRHQIHQWLNKLESAKKV